MNSKAGWLLLGAVLTLSGSAFAAEDVEIFADKGEEKTDNTLYTGDIRLVKNGEGSIKLLNVNSDFTGGLVVRAGKVICGGTLGGSQTNNVGKGIAGTGTTITVEKGATFDFALSANNAGWKNFVIAGTGCDGKGALQNTGSTAMAYTGGSIFELTLTDDALIGGNQISIAKSAGGQTSYIRLNGHTLTLDCDNNATKRRGVGLASTEVVGPGLYHVLGTSYLATWNNGGTFTNDAVLQIDEGAVWGLRNAATSTITGTKIVMYGTIGFDGNSFVASEEFRVNAAMLGSGKLANVSGTGMLAIDAGEAYRPTAALNTKLTGGVRIASGRFYHSVPNALGPQFTHVYVSEGATLESVGANQKLCNYTLHLAGDGVDGNGAHVNTTGDIDYSKSQPISNIVVEADASIGGTYRFGIAVQGFKLANVDLNGHTLTKKGTNEFTLVNTKLTSSVEGGVLRVDEGMLSLALSPVMNFEAPVVVGSNGTLNVAKNMYSGYNILANQMLNAAEIRCEPGATIVGSRWPDGATIEKFVLDLSSLFKDGAKPKAQRVLNATGLTDSFRPEVVGLPPKGYAVEVDSSGVKLVTKAPEGLLIYMGGGRSQPTAKDNSLQQLGGGFAKPVYCYGSPWAGDADAQVAVIALHGWGGGMSDVNTGLRANLEKLDPTIRVYSPLFPVSANDGRAVWNKDWVGTSGPNTTDWRGGGVATDTELSSFDVIDAMLTKLSDTTLFPRLKRVVLVGFSAGGQFVGRYVAVGKCPVRDGLTVEYVVLSPSTEFLYDDSYDWHYGLKNRPAYPAATTDGQIMANLTSRRVWRGVGTKDTGTGGLDMTDAANAQGENRYERQHNFKTLINEKYPDWAKMTTFKDIPGAGHSNAAVYSDADLLAFIVNKTR